MHQYSTHILISLIKDQQNVNLCIINILPRYVLKFKNDRLVYKYTKYFNNYRCMLYKSINLAASNIKHNKRVY